MQSGLKKTYYTGIAKNADEFVVAAYCDALTEPNELAFATTQLTFNRFEGWSARYFDDQALVDYAIDGDGAMFALSRSGHLLNARDGSVVTRVDPTNFAHFSGIVDLDADLLVCGDNGSFYRGGASGFRRIKNPFHRPVPGADATLQERIAWGQSMRPFYSVERTGMSRAVISGAKGTLLTVEGDRAEQITTSIDANIVNLKRSSERTLFCGHTPSSVIGWLSEHGSVTMLFVEPGMRLLVSVVDFAGKTYVADADNPGGVFELTDGALIRAPFSDAKQTGAARHLAVSGGVLWAIFERALVRFDGKDWTTHTHPSEL